MAEDVLTGQPINGQPIGQQVVSGPGAALTWVNAPAVWSTLVLGGLAWPGQWDIEPSGEERDIDKKKPKGKHGNTMRDNGIVGGSVKIAGTITPEEYPIVRDLIALVSPRRPNGVRTPITISHPDCDIIGLNEIYIQKIKPKGPKTGKDFWEVEIFAIQWFPEPKEVKKPKPEAIVTRAEANRIFQGLEQELDPLGPQPDETFSESIGRLADRANFVTGPDRIPPPYEEPP